MLKKSLSIIAKVSASCLMAVVFLFPQVSFGAFGDITIWDYNVAATTFTTATSTTALTYSCPIGFTLSELSFYTRSLSSSRTLGLSIDGVSFASTTINTTPSYFTYSGLNTPCLTGSFAIKFPISGSSFYLYQTQEDVYNDFKLKFTNPGGTSYGLVHKAKFILPINIATTSTSTSMATTTVISSNDATLNFLLLYLVFWLTVFGLVFIFKPLYVRK